MGIWRAFDKLPVYARYFAAFFIGFMIGAWVL